MGRAIVAWYDFETNFVRFQHSAILGDNAQHKNKNRYKNRLLYLLLGAAEPLVSLATLWRVGQSRDVRIADFSAEMRQLFQPCANPIKAQYDFTDRCQCCMREL